MVIEDDPKIALFLERGLEAEGHAVTVASSAEDARRWLSVLGPELELILLDLGLPGEDGTDLLRWLRAGGFAAPVIVVSARDDLRDKVTGLDAGANDYITKPFAFDELLARIRAVRRSTGQPTQTELVVGDLRLDLLTKVAQRGGRQIELAPREWVMLELFMRHPRQVLSRSQILSNVWSYSFEPGSNVVDVYVGYLRRKINLPGLAPLIQTVRGAGYRLLPPTSD
ncbi:MAG: response regulator transcription factor [Actinomycetota bacterium]|nr:response regulator transcription factor [Actinomycetota bacterium]MDA8366662.1 response regulator transcription factor [Actinomycetota bacterium]